MYMPVFDMFAKAASALLLAALTKQNIADIA
jgi:hypothetical protein